MKLRLPSPAMAVALIALFVALGGTAFATANAIAPKAKLALNSLKLQGKTAAQVAAIPGPAASASGLVSVRTVSFSIGASSVQQVSPACQSGEKAVSGGYSSSGAVLSATTAPSSDGSSWQMVLINLDSTAGTSGTGYAVCLK